MGRMRVYLSGDMVIERGDHVLRGERLPGRQGREVFALLATREGTPVPRAEIADHLWRGTVPGSWDTALSAIVSKIRTSLSEVGVDGSSTLRSIDGCYVLNLPTGAWVDHREAFDSIHAAEAAISAGDPAAAYAPSAIARHIAERPFLPGAEAAWIEARRDELRSVHVRALECRAIFYTWNEEYTLAVAAAKEATRRTPLRESAHRLLMSAHASAGNGAQAMQAYEDLRQLLADELGVAPSPDTKRLHAEILKTL